MVGVDDVRTSQALARVLRHAPDSVGVTLDAAGWVGVPALLDALADPDPGRRPPSATEALRRLRRLPLPAPSPGLVLPDRLGPPPYAVAGPARVVAALACLCFALATVLSLAAVVRAT